MPPSDIRRLLDDFGIQRCETFQRQMLEDRLARSLVTLGDNGNAYMYAYTIAVNIPFISLLNRALPRIKKLLKNSIDGSRSLASYEEAIVAETINNVRLM